MAIHKTLCNSEAAQFLITNLFFQSPLFKPYAKKRRESHMRHHFHTNVAKIDPSVIEMVDAGLKKGMSYSSFIYFIFYSITPQGIIQTISNSLRNTFDFNYSIPLFILRIGSVSIFTLLFYYFDGVKAIGLYYLIPAFIIYPFLGWISQLAEHRWLIETSESDKKIRECIIGRPIDYPGITGFIIRYLIFPFGDSYHLAHSLYPKMHWLALKDLDSKLKMQNDTPYCQFWSKGLIWPQEDGVPSAFSDLKSRIVC